MSAVQIEEAIAQLRDKDHSIRRDAIKVLGEIADASAVSTIIEMLQDHDWLVRCAAAEALGEIRDPSAVPMLIELWKDQTLDRYVSYRVYNSAAEALGKIGNAPAVIYLIEVLKSKEFPDSVRAADTLGEIGEVSAVPFLIRNVKPSSFWASIVIPIAAAAARALLKLGNSETLPRKILACPRLTACERIEILDALRHFRCNIDDTGGPEPHRFSLRYSFPNTRTLCRIVLAEQDEAVRKGAQAVLDWLNGDRNLLIPSQYEPANEAQTLLHAAQGSSIEAHPDTLLIASDDPAR